MVPTPGSVSEPGQPGRQAADTAVTRGPQQQPCPEKEREQFRQPAARKQASGAVPTTLHCNGAAMSTVAGGQPKRALPGGAAGMPAGTTAAASRARQLAPGRLPGRCGGTTKLAPPCCPTTCTRYVCYAKHSSHGQAQLRCPLLAAAAVGAAAAASERDRESWATAGWASASSCPAVASTRGWQSTLGDTR